MKLTTLLLLLLGLSTFGRTQDVVLNGPGGFNADSPYNRLYDTSTVITVKGEVVGKQVAPPMDGMGNAITLLVKSADKTWHVDVGPEWYVSNQKTQIKVKDQVQVTGSRVKLGGNDVILAEQIVKNKKVLALRRPMGRPYWDAVYSEEPAGATRKEVSGEIVGIDYFNDGTNGPTERLHIDTDGGEVLVALAPRWYMQRQNIQLAMGSVLNINAFAPVGTPTQPAGNNLVAPPIVFATSFRVAHQWVVLRSATGVPMWYGAGD